MSTRPDARRERGSTTWDEIEAVVDEGGFRAGFVAVFLEFQGAVLDDEPLDARGMAKTVNQSNFAKHFGIAVSTFHRWLGEFAPEGAGFGPKEPERAAAAKERQRTKAQKKDADAEAAAVRRAVADSREEFRRKVEVHRSDSNLWFIDLQTLAEWDAPPPEKAAAVEEALALLDEEADALARAQERLLAVLTSLDVDGMAGAA